MSCCIFLFHISFKFFDLVTLYNKILQFKIFSYLNSLPEARLTRQLLNYQLQLQDPKYMVTRMKSTIKDLSVTTAMISETDKKEVLEENDLTPFQ